MCWSGSIPIAARPRALPAPMSTPRPKFSPQAGEGATAADGEDDDGARNLRNSCERSMEQPLAKALRGVSARIDDMAARVKKIEDQPLPLGTTSVRVAEKADDAIFPKPEALLDQPGASRRSPKPPSARRSRGRCGPFRASSRGKVSLLAC